MPVELPQDVYDAMNEASVRLSDAGEVVAKSSEKHDDKEENTIEKTRLPRHQLTASERARYRRIGEELFRGGLDKARQVKEAQEFQAKMNELFQRVAHNSWDNALQAFLNMKLNVEKLYRELKGEDYGIFRSIWKKIKPAINAFRITMFALKMSPLLLPVIKSSLGAFLSPFVDNLKHFHNSVSDTSFGKTLNSFANSVSDTTYELQESALGKLGQEMLEWGKTRAKIFISSIKLAIDDAMSFLKPALTILGDVIWLTIEGAAHGGPYGAAIGAVIGLVVGLIETVPDIIDKYRKNKKQASIAFKQDDRIKEVKQSQERLQNIILDMEKRLKDVSDVGKRRELMNEIREKIYMSQQMGDELYELQKAKLLSESSIIGLKTVNALKKIGLTEGKDFKVVEVSGRKVITNIRGAELTEGGITQMVKAVENACDESLRKVIDNTKLKDMSTQEFLKNYEIYRRGDTEHISKEFSEVMKEIEEQSRAKEMVENAAGILKMHQEITEEFEREIKDINKEGNELLKREQEILTELKRQTDEDEKRLQTLLKEIQSQKGGFNFWFSSRLMQEMPQWVSTIFNTMGSLMNTLESPITKVLLEKLSALINETLERFNFDRAEAKSELSKKVGTHGDGNTMLNIIRTEEISITKELSKNEDADLSGRSNTLRNNLRTLTENISNDRLLPRQQKTFSETLKEKLEQNSNLTNEERRQILSAYEKNANTQNGANTGVETHPAVKPTLRLNKLVVEDHYIMQRGEKETVVSNVENTMNALTWCIPGTALNVNNDEDGVIIIS